MFLKKIMSIALLFALSACGGGHNPDKDALNKVPALQNLSGEKFYVLSSEEALSYGDGTLKGTGRVRFAEDLGSVQSAYHYALTFSLDDSGELTLISHSNSSLLNGMDVRFKRSGNKLLVFASFQGSSVDWSASFIAIDASKEMKIGVDLHNDEAISHILFWNDLVSSEDIVFDSGLDLLGGGAPGKGRGQHWGLELKNAEVKDIRREDPRDEH